MNFNKAQDIGKIVNEINKCQDFLKSLKGHSYKDEYVIYYRGWETCELEEEALDLLVDFYETKIISLKDTLNKL